MSLSEQGKAILALLVDDINQGRYRPEGEKTFCGYREVHVRLGLQRKGPHWGNSLRTQGLVDLAEWIRQNKLPAITGLIVDQTSYRPGPGYYEVNGATAGDERW